MNVDISDLNKADVLAALFNAADAPRRMGVLQASNGPVIMTEEWATRLINLGNEATPDYGGFNRPGIPELYFDYLYGRCLKINLTGNTFDSWGFDRDNGGDGSAQQVIDHLRQTGEVNITPDCEASTWLKQVVDEALKRYDEGDLGGAIVQFLIGTARHPGTKHIPEWEFVGPLLAMSFKQGREEAEKAMVGFTV